MAKITIKVQGFEKVIASFNRFNKKQKAKLRRIIATTSFEIQSDAKRSVPVDTGRLRNSLRIKFDNGGLTGTIGTNVFYAPFVEFGTKRQRSKPYLFPAFRKAERRYKRRVKAAFGKIG